MIEANLMGEKRDEKEVVFQVGLLQRHTILMLEPTFLGILRDTTHTCLAKQVLKLDFNRAKHGPTTFKQTWSRFYTKKYVDGKSDTVGERSQT